MRSNSENSKAGREFEELAAVVLKECYEKDFWHRKKIMIGKPPKLHEFDLVSTDKAIAAECKCYKWTDGHNSPSAKMSILNEAVFFLSFLPDTYEKVIVMERDKHPKSGEPLAEYYYRRYRHLLSNVTLLEMDSKTQAIREIRDL